MRKRVFGSIFLTSLFTLLLTAAIVLGAVYSGLSKEVKRRIYGECSNIASVLENDRLHMMKNIETIGKSYGDRITLVSSGGQVIFDNQTDPLGLESHSDRPEIIDAAQTGEGSSERWSGTFGMKSFYYARRLSTGDVLRIGVTTESVFSAVSDVSPWILFMLMLTLCAALAIAGWLTRIFIAPIILIDLQNPLDNKTYGELSPLLRRIARQNRQIDEQIKELRRSQTEFGHITENMDEGLILLSGKGDILFANRKVRAVFPDDSVSGNYLRLCRDTEYIRVVKSAINGTTAHGRMEKNGRVYDLTCGAAGDGAAALFFLDVTEQVQAEEQRKEFSANVSHELKTPLTSIIGYAEIIENGIVQEGDIVRFAGKIHSEAKRLLSLIQDIIHLSSLDEAGGKVCLVPADLFKVCSEACENLRQKAERYHVKLSLDGSAVTAQCQPQTLEQMVFNLIDNAIVYNKPNGSVSVFAGTENGSRIIRVRDTGIGIAPADQHRVFERFYRVDKSHSKTTGGTGLGLSIVKHGAIVHNAEIRLSSALGEGTEIVLKFPDDV